jgi:hypothetical protein
VAAVGGHLNQLGALVFLIFSDRLRLLLIASAMSRA